MKKFDDSVLKMAMNINKTFLFRIYLGKWKLYICQIRKFEIKPKNFKLKQNCDSYLEKVKKKKLKFQLKLSINVQFTHFDSCYCICMQCAIIIYTCICALYMVVVAA